MDTARQRPDWRPGAQVTDSHANTRDRDTVRVTGTGQSAQKDRRDTDDRIPGWDTPRP